MERYFNISYSYGNSKINGFGCLDMTVIGGFPSKSFIFKNIKESLGYIDTTIAIISIYEFKSKQDYLDYNKD